MNVLNILNNIAGWFVNFRVYINSPIIINNLTKAIEDSTDDTLKKKIRFMNIRDGVEEAFNKYLKEKK